MDKFEQLEQCKKKGGGNTSPRGSIAVKDERYPGSDFKNNTFNPKRQGNRLPMH